MAIKTCVSLYSLQDEYMHHRMTLDQIMDWLVENNVEGFEILPDQMIHGAPHPTDETLKAWDEMREKHPSLVPVCDDVFLNTNQFINRTLTKKECVSLLVEEMKLANRLGIKLMRFVSMTPGWVIEPLLPYAEKYDITFGLEVHAALGFDVPKTQGWLEEMKRLDDPRCGIVVDTSMFCHRMPRVFDEYVAAINGPVSQEVIDYFNGLFDKGLDARTTLTPEREIKPEVAKLIKSPGDEAYIGLADSFENTPISTLDDYMKYVKHVHFKLWEMTEWGEEYSIDYKKIIQYLHDHNYDGYVATEYEGNRWTAPGKPIVEKQQVAAHQKMIHQYIKEIEG